MRLFTRLGIVFLYFIVFSTLSSWAEESSLSSHTVNLSRHPTLERVVGSVLDYLDKHPENNTSLAPVPMAPPGETWAPTPHISSNTKSQLTVSAATALITEVAFKDNRLVIQASPSSRVKVLRTFTLEGPRRLVVDLEDAVLARKDLAASIPVGNQGIQQVRVGQFEDSTVRIVINTDYPQAYRVVSPSDNTAMLFIQSSEIPVVASHTGFSNQQANMPVGAVAQLDGFGFFPAQEGRPATLQIQADEPLVYRIQQQKNRVFITLTNVEAKPGLVNFPKNQLPQVSSIRFQNPPEGGRGTVLVLELADEDLYLSPHLSFDAKSLEVALGKPMGAPVASNPQNNEEEDRETSDSTTRGPVVKAPFAARIVVDAGHGGKDKGTNRESVYEKYLNLDVALRLRKALEARGLRVYMTRSTDEFLPLSEITRITNNVGPDLFVSIHHNASENPATYGLETYYYTPQSLPLARKVHQQMARAISDSPDRGVRRAMFYVIHHTAVPAILCELGYVSNPTERARLVRPERQQKAAEAIADGVVGYLRTRMSAQAK